ncbi:hypothetical protein [Leptolyngbya sp. 'hensonii']|nr:hypothetical protein [Leptolyngbya sp. 'hensonii']
MTLRGSEISTWAKRKGKPGFASTAGQAEVRLTPIAVMNYRCDSTR